MLLSGTINDPIYGPRFLEGIHRNTLRLRKLLDDLLDLSKLDAGKYSLKLDFVSPHILIEQTIEELKSKIESKGQRLDFQLDPNTVIYTDESAFCQIMTNYIDNAIKYTPSQSVITIDGQEIGERFQISVKDNGPGIPKKYIPRVFERFFRVDKGRSRDEGGTGLGLSIVRNLAHAAGARVGVENLSPQGAHFWCSFPIKSTLNEEILFDETDLLFAPDPLTDQEPDLGTHEE